MIDKIIKYDIVSDSFMLCFPINDPRVDLNQEVSVSNDHH